MKYKQQQTAWNKSSKGIHKAAGRLARSDKRSGFVPGAAYFNIELWMP